MQTRRELLQQTLVALVATGGIQARGVEIVPEQTLLSRESARGFSMLEFRSRVIVLPAAGKRAIAAAPDLFRRAHEGTWVIWEGAVHNLRPDEFAALQFTLTKVFQIRIGAPFRPGMYIEYVWPQRLLTRSFLEAVPVECSQADLIAVHNSRPVAMRRAIGNGGIIFLGSMLGPNLYAEEAQAHQAGATLQCYS